MEFDLIALVFINKLLIKVTIKRKMKLWIKLLLTFVDVLQNIVFIVLRLSLIIINHHISSCSVDGRWKELYFTLS